MRRVRVNIHDERTDVVAKERNEKNISMINYVSAKWKLKRGKMNVNISHSSWGVQLINRRSGKGEPVRMIESSN